MARNATHRLRHVSISTAASGDTILVAAPSVTQYVTVVNYALVATGAVAVAFKSNATALSGAMSLAANGGISFGGQPESPAFSCAKGEALNLNLSGAIQVSGHFTYIVEE